MNERFYPQPRFIPGELVYFWSGSQDASPVITTIRLVTWDASGKCWRYTLNQVNQMTQIYTFAEHELNHYFKGCIIPRKEI